MASTISAGTSAGTALNLVGDTTGSLALQTNNGTTALTIDTSQNVGIGTTSSINGAKLSVSTSGSAAYFGTSSASYSVFLTSASSATNGAFNNTQPVYIQNTDSTNGNRTGIGFFDGSGSIVNEISSINVNHSTHVGALTFNTRNAGSYGERMRIDQSGNVGIGTNSPAYPLEVNGAGQFGGYARITASGGGQRLLMGNQDSIGTNKPAIIASGNSNISFGYGDSWSTSGGNLTSLFSINVTGASNDFASVLAGGTTLYPAYFARSFVAVNQQGTQSILCSGNVSSITDQGTGLTLVTMTTAMPDINYTVANGISGSGVISGVCLEINRNSSSTYQLRSLSTAAPTAYDMNYVTAIVMR